jgi:hypothetical protein
VPPSDFKDSLPINPAAPHQDRDKNVQRPSGICISTSFLPIEKLETEKEKAAWFSRFCRERKIFFSFYSS